MKKDIILIILLMLIGLVITISAIKNFDRSPGKCVNKTKKVMVIYTENRTSLNPKIEYDKIIVCDDEGCYISKKLIRKAR